MRQQLVKYRVAQSNNLRGLLTEYGEVMSMGRAALNEAFPVVIARLIDRLPAVLIDTLRDQWSGLTELDKRISEIERRLGQWMKRPLKFGGRVTAVAKPDMKRFKFLSESLRSSALPAQD